ncbi:MAG: hypothetical protein AAFY98_00225 [Verrucomicrobiota bacterium]
MKATLCGLVIGIFLGLSPLSQMDVLPGKALWTLGLGLGITYLSIGALVGFLPLIGPFQKASASRWVGVLFGFVVGAAYSVPGAFFTMAPYPLAEDAAPYWREFSDGGLRAFFLTLSFGGAIGGLCGLFRKNLKVTA